MLALLDEAPAAAGGVAAAVAVAVAIKPAAVAMAAAPDSDGAVTGCCPFAGAGSGACDTSLEPAAVSVVSLMSRAEEEKA